MLSSLFALGLGAGCSAAAEAADSSRMVRSYLALGDSYTIGQSVSPAERWLSAALHQSAPQGPFDLVTLLIGVNDQFRGYELATYRAALIPLLHDALTLAGGHAGQVVVLSIPDWGVTPFAAGQDRGAIAASIDGFNALAKQEVAALGAHWVDITPLTRDIAMGGMVAPDGLHPSGAMYARWVAATVPVVLGISPTAVSRPR